MTHNAACVAELTASFDATGGEFTSPDGFVLRVPNGAVNETVTISITPIAPESILVAGQPVAGLEAVVSALHFEPEGLSFAIPIELTLPAHLLGEDFDANEDQFFFAGFSNDGFPASDELEGSLAEGQTAAAFTVLSVNGDGITVRIPHFTETTLHEVSEEDPSVLTDILDMYSTVYETALELGLPSCQAALALGWAVDKLTLLVPGQPYDFYHAWWTGTYNLGPSTLPPLPGEPVVGLAYQVPNSVYTEYPGIYQKDVQVSGLQEELCCPETTGTLEATRPDGTPRKHALVQWASGYFDFDNTMISNYGRYITEADFSCDSGDVPLDETRTTTVSSITWRRTDTMDFNLGGRFGPKNLLHDDWFREIQQCTSLRGKDYVLESPPWTTEENLGYAVDGRLQWDGESCECLQDSAGEKLVKTEDADGQLHCECPKPEETQWNPLERRCECKEEGKVLAKGGCCPEGQTYCDGTCEECCSDDECSGGMTCQGNNTCACPASLNNCNGTCQECCANAHCSQGKYCEVDSCVCPQGQRVCAATGACQLCCADVDCSGGMTCQSNYTCACPEGLNNCNGTCQECCANAHCSQGKYCEVDSCVCPQGQRVCAATGACQLCCADVDCSGGMTCQSNYTCACPEGLNNCNGTCQECCANAHCSAGMYCDIDTCVSG